MPEIPEALDALMTELLGEQKEQFFQQAGTQLPHTFRFNPLKGPEEQLAEIFQEQGFTFQPVEGFPGVYQMLHQPYPVGKSLSHFLGHIYIQDLASMLPAFILDPRPGEWVLDMSAAPGSKTTLLATMMNNEGVILANDVVMKRIRSLISNLQRMGVVNTIIFKWFGEQFGNQYFETFDRVLLDPACSGLGTLHKSPEVLSWWTPAHCERLAAGQKALLISAIKALKPGGTVTYSTCTLTPEENEEVVNEALENFPVELEPISLPGLKTHPGLTEFRGRKYHPHLARAIRLYPTENPTEGFFIARLRKTDSLPPPRLKKPRQAVPMKLLQHDTSPLKKYLDYLAEHFQIPRETFSHFSYSFQKDIVFLSREISQFPFYGRPVRMGLVGARPMERGAKFTTEGAQLLGYHATRHVVELADLRSLEKFVNREELSIPVEGTGQVLVKYKNCIIGYGIIDRNVLKSQFPKAEWPFHLTGEDSNNETDSP